MKKLLILLLVWGLPAAAQDHKSQIEDIVANQIRYAYADLTGRTEMLAHAAKDNCNPDYPGLRENFARAFQSWSMVSHYRFGPTEEGNRAFALAFWPDKRGKTPQTLRGIITNENPAIESAEEFAKTSIAGRGFYALEYMLYDPGFREIGTAEYRCRLIQRLAADIHRNTSAIRDGWADFAPLLTDPGPDGPYRSEDEVLRQLFNALTTGLQFTSEARLGLPLGTFDNPHPMRAEMRRSGQSRDAVVYSLLGLRELAVRLAGADDALYEAVDSRFQSAISTARALDDPGFAGTADPISRFRIEALQQKVDDIREVVAGKLGPHLGVAAGFNAMDGD